MEKRPRKIYKNLYELIEDYTPSGKRSIITLLKRADKIMSTWDDLHTLSDAHIQEIFDFFSFCVNDARMEKYVDDIAESWPNSLPLCIQIGAPIMHEMAEAASKNLWDLLPDNDKEEIIQLKNTITMFNVDKIISFMINYDSYRIAMPAICSEEDFQDYDAELLNRCIQLIREGGSVVVRLLENPNKIFGVVAKNGTWMPIPKDDMKRTYRTLTSNASICDNTTEPIEIQKIII